MAAQGTLAQAVNEGRISMGFNPLLNCWRGHRKYFLDLTLERFEGALASLNP
jgi:hypothetical protein